LLRNIVTKREKTYYRINNTSVIVEVTLLISNTRLEARNLMTGHEMTIWGVKEENFVNEMEVLAWMANQ